MYWMDARQTKMFQIYETFQITSTDSYDEK